MAGKDRQLEELRGRVESLLQAQSQHEHMTRAASHLHFELEMLGKEMDRLAQENEYLRAEN